MLIEASGGNRDAFDKLLPVVYAELRRAGALSDDADGYRTYLPAIEQTFATRR